MGIWDSKYVWDIIWLQDTRGFQDIYRWLMISGQYGYFEVCLEYNMAIGYYRILGYLQEKGG